MPVRKRRMNYRYFPDPDLLPTGESEQAWLMTSVPTCPNARRQERRAFINELWPSKRLHDASFVTSRFSESRGLLRADRHRAESMAR